MTATDLAPAAAMPAAREPDWPESSCYLDLWDGALRAWGLESRAMLPFILGTEFEGDQFTFLKPPLEDLESLYGIVVRELSLYGRFEDQLALQLERGRLVLVEVDAFHLPDAAGTSYRQQHRKTTIGIDGMDRAARRLRYFHNAGRYTLEAEDFEPLIQPAALLPPYVEIARRAHGALFGPALREASLALLRRHLRALPSQSPIMAMREAFPTQLAELLETPEQFHDYAFNTLRQLGSGFERLAAYAGWLAETTPAAEAAMAPCLAISTQAKTLQFRLARMVARRRSDAMAEAFSELEANHAAAIAAFQDVARATAPARQAA